MRFKGWQEVTLGDISIGNKGSYGIAASAVEYSEDKYTYLRITDINDDGTLNSKGLMSVDDADAYKYILKPNDIVFARTGNSTGRSYFYDGFDGELVYAGFLIKFSIDPKKVNPKFLKYYTLSSQYHGWVTSFASGSTRKNINAKTYSEMKINLPPRKYQNFIVNTLEKLDNKQRNNNLIIDSLEDLTQTLFKNWFVDFEFPNDAGKPYKSSGGKMVESELGMIPRGWEVNSLSGIANFQNGLAMQRYRPKEDENSLPVLKIKELRQGFTDLNSDICSINIRDSVKVFNGDVIFSWSATLLVKLWVGGNAGLNQHLFKVTSEDHPKWFYYLWTKHYLDIFNAIAQDKTTTMGHIKRSHLDESKVLIPKEEQYSYFDSIFNLIINQKINLALENVTLENIRDTLLPKLLSGEIEIPDDTEVMDNVPVS